MTKTNNKQEKLEPTDFITLDKQINVNVNSNVHNLFSNIAKERGLNGSLVIRQFLLDYVKKGMAEQKDLFSNK